FNSFIFSNMPFSLTKRDINFIPSFEYHVTYQESLMYPEKFWLKEAEKLDWIVRPTIAKNASSKDDVRIKWFEDGKLNACYNCVDRHVDNGNGNNIAISWEGDDPSRSNSLTYKGVLQEVSTFANILEKNGIKKGDRMGLYMP